MRKKIQRLLWDLPGYATWGLRPKWSNVDDEFVPLGPSNMNDEDGHILRTGLEIFELIQCCASIKRLSVEFWDENWLRMTEERNKVPRCSFAVHGFTIHRVSHSTIENIAFRLKYCKGPWVPVRSDRLAWMLEDTFGGMSSFPALRELSFEPIYTDPGPWSMRGKYETTEDESSSEQNEDDSSDEPCKSSGVHYTLTQLEEAYIPPPGLTLNMMHSLNAKLDLGLVQLPKLEKLVLTNVTLDARCLLLWLCEQEQLPVSGLSICLQGTTFLFDLDPKTLFQGLTQLNVSLCYDPERTFHYPPSPAGFVDELYGNKAEYFSTWSAGQTSWSKYAVDELAWETLPAQMPAFPSPETVSAGAIEFRRRPSAFMSIQNAFRHQKPDIEVVYYSMPGVEGGICDWFDNTTDQPGSLTILVYRTHWDYWPAGYFSEEFENEILSHTTDLYHRARELEWQEQQPLMQYEGELLGLDIMRYLYYEELQDVSITGDPL
ncbi:uncharacterized protein A1O5_13228 [Cladophialophora psammophila CBS 110553]|uniref:Uncharacterized protein n=1 Tax=Cladophialophora psammophila CBS 110553 TaxID=1182543 RepID=W9VN48_9EURO|nr:uncharacterized protein A1O5_13228 [Cladophialophora psammophila CBS 110553]EXJ53556.1 hypothetical protein A1O5_13228 [Cladophialophora psammophila CBS 110553]